MVGAPPRARCITNPNPRFLPLASCRCRVAATELPRSAGRTALVMLGPAYPAVLGRMPRRCAGVLDVRLWSLTLVLRSRRRRLHGAGRMLRSMRHVMCGVGGVVGPMPRQLRSDARMVGPVVGQRRPDRGERGLWRCSAGRLELGRDRHRDGPAD